jgi:hypothetical protein
MNKTINGVKYTTEMTIDEYHREKEHYSNSTISPGYSSLRDIEIKLKTPDKKESYFDIGNAFETLLLEPDSFESQVAVFDTEKRPEQEKTMASKKNKEWKEEFYSDNANKLILTPEDMILIHKMVKETLQVPIVQGYMKAGIEIGPSLFFEYGGVKYKSRPDFVYIDHEQKEVVILDIKSTRDSDPRRFARTVNDYKYWSQAIMQIIGFEQMGYKVLDYNWIVCDKNPVMPTAHAFRFMPENQEYAKEKFDSLSSKIFNALSLGKFGRLEDEIAVDSGIIELKLTIY